jgi:multisubunit Na+/H+ antiporter MnhE subunit
MTAAPSTVMVDLDQHRQRLVIHVVDASDPEALRGSSSRFYERFQRHVFP